MWSRLRFSSCFTPQKQCHARTPTLVRDVVQNCSKNWFAWRMMTLEVNWRLTNPGDECHDLSFLASHGIHQADWCGLTDSICGGMGTLCDRGKQQPKFDCSLLFSQNGADSSANAICKSAPYPLMFLICYIWGASGLLKEISIRFRRWVTWKINFVFRNGFLEEEFGLQNCFQQIMEQ